MASQTPFGPERLQGAAPISPEILRNQFYGTAPDGPALTGTMLSSPFVLTKPWLIVPYAGYPTGNGNGLRIRLIDARDQQLGDEIGCPGPNVDGVSFWVVDVRAHVGERARLVLYDGRTDTEAWVAASPPIPADNPDLALTLAHGLQAESHVSVRIAIAMIALVGLVCAFCRLAKPAPGLSVSREEPASRLPPTINPKMPLKGEGRKERRAKPVDSRNLPAFTCRVNVWALLAFPPAIFAFLVLWWPWPSAELRLNHSQTMAGLTAGVVLSG